MNITNYFTDPHHGYSSDFGFHYGEFYHRHTGTKNWTRVKKISLTPQRVLLLAGLVEKARKEATNG